MADFAPSMKSPQRAGTQSERDENVLIKPESILQRIGSPPEFGVVILLVTFALAVTPYLAGADFGTIKIPTFEQQPKLKKRLRLIGPLALALVLFLHVPLLPPPSITTAPTTSTVPSANPTSPSNDVTRTEPTTGSATTNAEPLHTLPLNETLAATTAGPHSVPLQTSSAPAATEYEVSLLIPTSMSGAEVWLDGREATIKSRTETLIKISVPAAPGNRHIELTRDGTRPCKTTIEIGANMTLTPCS